MVAMKRFKEVGDGSETHAGSMGTCRKYGHMHTGRDTGSASGESPMHNNCMAVDGTRTAPFSV